MLRGLPDSTAQAFAALLSAAIWLAIPQVPWPPAPALLIPAAHATATLPELAPAWIVLDVELAGGAYPLQLGQWEPEGRFRYYGLAAAGIAYGRTETLHGPLVYIIELSASRTPGDYTAELLEGIRSAVATVNAAGNVLLRSRANPPPVPPGSGALLEALFRADAQTACQPGGLPQLSRALELYPPAEFREAINAVGRYLARLKAEYYARQRERLKLMAAKFEYQAALARMDTGTPEEFSGMAAAERAETTAREVLSGLVATWEKRLTTANLELELLAATRQELGAEDAVELAIPQDAEQELRAELLGALITIRRAEVQALETCLGDARELTSLLAADAVPTTPPQASYEPVPHPLIPLAPEAAVPRGLGELVAELARLAGLAGTAGHCTNATEARYPTFYPLAPLPEPEPSLPPAHGLVLIDAVLRQLARYHGVLGARQYRDRLAAELERISEEVVAAEAGWLEVYAWYARQCLRADIR